MKRLGTHTLNTLLRNRSGDQVTGWLIVVLIVVVTGAVFLSMYQTGITDIWNGIMDRIRTTFGI